MFTRQYLAVAVVVCGLAAGLPALLAEENGPTASELYDQGISLFEQGELSAARDTFRRVDPMQLPKEARLKYYDAIKSIDQQLGAPAAEAAADTTEQVIEQADTQVDAAVAELEAAPEAAAAVEAPAATKQADTSIHPSQMLWQADDAMSDNPSLAASLYQAVLDDPRTDELTASQAKARLAQANRLAEPALNAAKEHLDLATAAANAGKYDLALGHVNAIQASGVVLGWRNQARLERLVGQIDAQGDVTPVNVTEPKTEPKKLPRYDSQADSQEPALVEAPVATVAAADEVSAPTEEEQAAAAEQAQADAPSQDLLRQVRLGYAQQKIAEGDQAQADGQLRLAISLYKQATELDPDNTVAKQKLDAAMNLQNKGLVPQGLVDEIIKREEVKAQEVTAEFNQSMNLASQRISERNFAAAFDAVADAKVVLDRNQRFLAPEAYRTLRGRAESLSAEIEAQRAVATRETLEEQEKTRAAKEAEAREAADRQKDEEIQKLLRRALDLQRDMKYQQALDLLDQALFLDPNDVAVNAIKEMIQEAKIVVEARDIRWRRDLARAQQSNINDAASIPYEEILTYPADWPQITYTRLSSQDVSGGESEADRAVAARLKEPVPISFEANRLANVIDYLRNTTDVNFFVNWPVLEAAGVDQDTLITLTLNNVPAEQALRLVLQQIGSEFDPIGFSIIEGVVNVSTVRDLSRTTDTRVYDIRDLLVQVPNFTNAPSFDLTQALSNTNSGGGGGGGGRGGGGGGGGGGGRGLFGNSNDEEDEEVPTRAELIDQITTLITETVGEFNEWSINGGDVSSLDELNGNLVVKSTPANHRNIVGLLAQLREIRSGQISIEARFLLVDESFMEETGFDFDVQINDLGGSFGPIRFAQDSTSIAGVKSTGAPNGTFGSATTTNVGPGIFVPGTGFAPATGRAADFSLSFLEDIEVNLLVKSTQASQRSLTLTAPRITISNGQRAYVTVATQRAFVSDLEPVPDAAGFDITLSVIQSGAVLDVEGTISADRRYVTLTLRPSLANIVNVRQIPIIGTTQTGTDGDGNATERDTFRGVIEAPELQITQVATTVSIPDQGTLLIGGQRIVGEIEVEAGVPVLSKIPVFNRLFSNNSMNKDQRTLLILVKPTIILQSEIEDNEFPGLMQDPGRFNISNNLR